MEKDAKNKTRARGRPPKSDEDKSVVVAASLPPDLAAFAKDELGDGSVSRGIQKALTEARKRKRKGKANAN